MLYQKAQQGSSWRLQNADGEPIGRIWSASHIDRILRDGALAEAVAAAIEAGGTNSARRQAIRAALDDWQTAGGHSVDFSAITFTLNNDAGEEDGNWHIYLAGNEAGYLHGVDAARDLRLARVIRLAEEIHEGEALATSGDRNEALDATCVRFTEGGGLS